MTKNCQKMAKTKILLYQWKIWCFKVVLSQKDRKLYYLGGKIKKHPFKRFQVTFMTKKGVFWGTNNNESDSCLVKRVSPNNGNAI